MPARTAERSTEKSRNTAPLDIEALLVNARDASEFLKALSHEARLVILCLLAEGEKSACRFATACPPPFR